MARQNPSEPTLTFDRRQLLTSAAAALTVARVVPTEATETANPAVAASNPATLPGSHPPALNVCASTAQRIEEIVQRNEIRQEAGLPLLSIAKELRRMNTADDLAQFERFAAVHRQAIWDEVLAPVREAKGEPHWRPTRWMEGMTYEAQVGKILRERFIAPAAFSSV